MEELFWVSKHSSSGMQYVVSTKRSLLDLDFINTALASDDMFWTKALPLPMLTTMLDNSLPLGLYVYNPSSSSSSDSVTPTSAASLTGAELKQVGLGRWVTDYVSYGWLSDVYVVPEHQGKGMGRFLVQCCGDALETIKNTGGVRRTMLMTSSTSRVPFYHKILGMLPHDQSGETKVLSIVKEIERS